MAICSAFIGGSERGLEQALDLLGWDHYAPTEPEDADTPLGNPRAQRVS
jgi:hypothetical protein